MFALNLGLALNLIVLFFAFFFRRNNTLPNRVLAFLLLDTAISFLGNASITGGFFSWFPYLFFLSWCTSCFFGPLTFSYTCLFTGSRLNFRHPVWIGAFLTAGFGLCFPLQYLSLPVADRPAFALSLLRDPLPWQMTVINVLTMLLIWTSLFAATGKIIRYRKRLVTTLSSLEKSKLTFITRFVGLIYLLTLATTVFYLVLPQHLVEYLYLPCLITLIYIYILVYTFREHSIFTTQSYQQFLEDTLPASEEMQADTSIAVQLPEPELRQLALRIGTYLDETQAFTNPDLSIGMLARGMRCPVDKISAAINKEMKQNFFDLINEKRVEKSKTLLVTKIQQMKIEAIAYEAGFNSRASFYRAFKKCTSMTPSEYLSKKSNASVFGDINL